MKPVTWLIAAGYSNPDSKPHNAASSAVKAYVMQNHAIALGYFFLSVFCIFTSSQGYLNMFRSLLLVVALLAALMGLGYLFIAWAAQFQATRSWLMQMVRLAQQAPVDRKQQSADGLSAN